MEVSSSQSYGGVTYYEDGMLFFKNITQESSVISYEKERDIEAYNYNNTVKMELIYIGVPYEYECVNPRYIPSKNGRYRYELTKFQIDRFIDECDKELPKEFVIPERFSMGEITVIEREAFYNSKSLVRIVLHDKITCIKHDAFMGCEQLEECNIPDSVTFIGKGVFKDTKIYKNTNNWKEGLFIYEGWVLDSKEDIEGEVSIPDGVKGIADCAFEERNITNVIISNSVMYICKDAFKECTGIDNTIIPIELIKSVN